MKAERKYFHAGKLKSTYFSLAVKNALIFCHEPYLDHHGPDLDNFYRLFNKAITSINDLPLSLSNLNLSKNAFPKQLHCILDSVFTKDTLFHLNEYYDFLSRNGFLRKSDQHVTQRIWAHNDHISRKIQSRLEEAVAFIVGNEIKKGFTSFLEYFEEAQLTKHLDREQATFTLSIQLQYVENNLEVENQWPISVVEKSGQTATHLIKNGQAILFKGNELVHYRSTLTKGHRSRVICLHFTTGEFSGNFL